jgi:hypothetical protein
VCSGYFQIGNNHFFVQFAFLEDVQRALVVRTAIELAAILRDGAE